MDQARKIQLRLRELMEARVTCHDIEWPTPYCIVHAARDLAAECIPDGPRWRGPISKIYFEQMLLRAGSSYPREETYLLLVVLAGNSGKVPIDQRTFIRAQIVDLFIYIASQMPEMRAMEVEHTALALELRAAA